MQPADLATWVPLILSVASTAIAILSFLHKARIETGKAPADAAGSLASAAGALGAVYEKRLQEQENAIAELEARVVVLEEVERKLAGALQLLGLQVEEAGLSPIVEWRRLVAALATVEEIGI